MRTRGDEKREKGEVKEDNVRRIYWISLVIILAGLAQFLLSTDNLVEIAITLFVVSIILFILYLTRWHPKFPSTAISHRSEMVLFAVIFVLGIFMRIYHIESIPPGLHGDEAWSGIEAVEILEGRAYTPYSPNVYGQTTMYFYFVAFLFKLLGATPVAIRLVSVVFGILTIPALYLFTRKACSAEVALCASFLLAVSRWHITLSRIGMMIVLGSFFAILTFYYLLRALDSKSTRDFILSGIFLSLGLNGYMAFRLVPFVFLLFLCFLLLRYKEQIADNLKGLTLFFASALVTITPLALYAVCNWDIFMGRVGAINIFKDHSFMESISLLGDNVRATLLMFNYEGCVWPHKNLPGEQMLDPILAMFFVLGLTLALYKWHTRTNFLLLSWFGVALLPGFLSIPAADSFRTSIVNPPAIIFGAIAIYWLGDELRQILSHKRMAAVVIIFLLISSGAYNYNAYFHEQANHPGVWHDFHYVPVEVAYYHKQLGEEYHMYLLSNWFYYRYESIRFLAPGLSGEDFFYKLGTYSPKLDRFPLKENLDKHAVFVILPHYNNVIPVLRECYPNGTLKVHKGGPRNEVIFTSYVIQKDELRNCSTHYKFSSC